MNDIQLRYGSGRNIRFKTPSNWNELTLKQLLFIIKTHVSIVKPDAGPVELKLQTHQFISAVTIKLMKEHFPPSMRRITAAEIIDLAKHHHFLASECSLFKQLLPSVTIGKHTLFGPDDGLSNAVFIEFLEANSALLNYLKFKKEEALNKFIAILYRPSIPGFIKGSASDKGDCRIPYHQPSVEARIKIAEKLNPQFKRIIQLWFSGCCKQLQQIFPEAFEGGSIHADFGIHGIIDSMAGSKWGKPEHVEHALLYRILISICRTARIKEEVEQ